MKSKKLLTANHQHERQTILDESHYQPTRFEPAGQVKQRTPSSLYGLVMSPILSLDRNQRPVTTCSLALWSLNWYTVPERHSCHHRIGCDWFCRRTKQLQIMVGGCGFCDVVCYHPPTLPLHCRIPTGICWYDTRWPTPSLEDEYASHTPSREHIRLLKDSASSLSKY